MKHYFTQMTKGCGVEGCTSPHCKSTLAPQAPKQALAHAVELAKKSSNQDEPVRYFFCLTPEEAARREAAEGLAAMGFPLAWCARALELKDGDAFNASSWIMEEMPAQ